MRSDRDASLRQVRLLEARLAEAATEREAAWAHGTADRELLERALQHTHTQLAAAQQEKEEAAYLARQDKQIPTLTRTLTLS